MQRYVVLDKKVGETPLMCAETWRSHQSPEYQNVPLAYAGRLDPMASGKLLVLIGKECKRQADYHGLDKAYEFSVLFGMKSDTADVLGLLSPQPSAAPVASAALNRIARSLIGAIELPYPHFSSKTVRGKPLHTWTLEGRLDEIDIPTKQSTIYKLKHTGTQTCNTKQLHDQALAKIQSLPPVTDPRKVIGNDFRRTDVCASWQQLADTYPDQTWQIAHFTCIASSGTYMRTLAEVIAREAGTVGLAWSIHRTQLGRYQQFIGPLRWWTSRFG